MTKLSDETVGAGFDGRPSALALWRKVLKTKGWPSLRLHRILIASRSDSVEVARLP